MPVYNVAHWLPETIQSILNQTFSDFEFLIINDGSSDNSAEIIKSFEDPRISYIKNEQNLGYIECLNFGLRRISSKYIVRMDADDVSLPDRIAHQVNYMEDHPEVVVCGGSRINIFENCSRKPQFVKAIINETELFVNSLFNTSIHHPCAILRTSVIKDNKLQYDERFYYAEDKDLWLRMSRFGVLANLSEPLLYYRIHKKQVTSLFLEIQRDNSTDITYEFFKTMGVYIDKNRIPLLKKICYEEQCKTLKELFEVEQLIFQIIDKAYTVEFKFVKELEKSLHDRLATIVSRSSRIGLEVLVFVRKSELMSLYQVRFMTYVKIISRCFYKGENLFLKFLHKKLWY